MSKSNLFRVHPERKALQSVKEINYSDFGFRERFDIQEWIESTPEILGEDLLIIAKEQSCFDGTRERPDLIALDKAGNTVIIELKRDDAGQNIEWQAIKYASYYSQFKSGDIVKTYADYLKKREKLPEADESNASQRIVEFVTDGTLDDINGNQRIFLVSHRFPREVISAVNWLIERYSLNMKCIQIIPYYDSDKEAHYLQSNEILPVVGVEDVIVTASGGTIAGLKQSGPVKKDDDITRFFLGIRDELFKRIDRDFAPDKYSRWAGVGPGYRYYHFWFNEEPWDNWGCSYKIWLFDKDVPEKEIANKFSVSMNMSKKHLLTHGITEEKIKNITELLKQTNIKGFEFGEKNDTIELEARVENNQLSDETRSEITEQLMRLIVGTKADISNLVE